MKSIYELNKNEIDELKQSLYFQFLDNDDDIIEELEDWWDIPFSILVNHYDSVMFVEEDFFCNM